MATFDNVCWWIGLFIVLLLILAFCLVLTSILLCLVIYGVRFIVLKCKGKRPRKTCRNCKYFTLDLDQEPCCRCTRFKGRCDKWESKEE